MPSRIGLILGMTTSDLEKVVYFAGYMVTKVDDAGKARFLKELDAEYKSKVKTANDDKTKEALKELARSRARKEIESISLGFVMDEVTYHKYAVKYGAFFEASIGAEAIFELLKKIDLAKLKIELEKAIEDAGSADREKLAKRLSLVKQMIKAKVRPEWMFLIRIPVIPPGLRPMVASRWRPLRDFRRE